MVPTHVSSGSTRSYRSERRERRARETRERILSTAGAEFDRAGYTATTMRRVAQAAGVSIATLELGFGTKPELLRATIRFAIRGDGDPVAMLQRPWARKALEASSVAEFLGIVGPVVLEVQQRAAGLILAAFEAAPRDESMSTLADQLKAQRVEASTWIVEELTRRDPLREGINREVAIDTVWLLMDPRVYIALTRDRGWTAEQFQEWFTDSVDRLLLISEAIPTRQSRRPDQPLTKRRTS